MRDFRLKMGFKQLMLLRSCTLRARGMGFKHGFEYPQGVECILEKHILDPICFTPKMACFQGFLGLLEGRNGATRAQNGL